MLFCLFFTDLHATSFYFWLMRVLLIYFGRCTGYFVYFGRYACYFVILRAACVVLFILGACSRVEHFSFYLLRPSSWLEAVSAHCTSCPFGVIPLLDIAPRRTLSRRAFFSSLALEIVAKSSARHIFNFCASAFLAEPGTIDGSRGWAGWRRRYFTLRHH